MNDYDEDINAEHLSLDDPVDWYYDDVAAHGYATQCVFSIFGDYVKQHNLSIELWGISFDGVIPQFESKDLVFEVLDFDLYRHYAHIKLAPGRDLPKECHFEARFYCDFYFIFLETKSDGTVLELDYYDDYCMK